MIVLHKYVDGVCMQCGKSDDGVRPQLCSGTRRREDHQRTRVETLTDRCEAVEAEVERLKDRCASYSEDVESLNGCVARLEAALYEARDEAAKLRAERRQLRRRLVECLPWVGRVPYPNTPGFSEMIACRDLAKDTLEEVPE